MNLVAFAPLPLATVPQVEVSAVAADPVDTAGLPALGMKGRTLVCVLSGDRMAGAAVGGIVCRVMGKSSDRNTFLIEQILNPSFLKPGSAGRVSISVRRDAVAVSRRYLRRTGYGQYGIRMSGASIGHLIGPVSRVSSQWFRSFAC